VLRERPADRARECSDLRAGCFQSESVRVESSRCEAQLRLRGHLERRWGGAPV